MAQSIKTPALVFTSLLLTLLLLELALRVFDIGWYWSVANYPDSQRGWHPYPSISSVQDIEGFAQIRTNQLGYRGADIPEKSDDEYRIAVLGDSFTAAVQVNEESIWWQLLEDRLNKQCNNSHKQIQVQNFAVSGYSPLQSYLTLQQDVIDYKPDTVILLLFTGNDLTEGHPDLADGRERPFLLPGDDWKIRYPETPVISKLRYWSNQLRLVQLISKAWYFVTRDDAIEYDKYDEPGIDKELYKSPTDKAWHEAWLTTERILRQFKTTLDNQAIQFLLVSASNSYQVVPDKGFREEFANLLNVPDLFHPEYRLTQFSRKNNMAYLALAPAMQELADQHDIFFHGFYNTAPGIGHWNNDGHRAAAELMTDFVCPSI